VRLEFLLGALRRLERVDGAKYGVERGQLGRFVVRQADADEVAELRSDALALVGAFFQDFRNEFFIRLELIV